LAASTSLSKDTASQGTLVSDGHTWTTVKDGEDISDYQCEIISDCRLDTYKSEYASKKGANCCAWQSKSFIKFEYRVVEVPPGSLLDPATDALIFGHLKYGSPEREAAMARPQRRLVVIDETVYGFYGAKVKAYFEARGVEHVIMMLPMT
jgi:hypothetical protein